MKSGIVYGKGPVVEVIDSNSVQVNKIWFSSNLEDRKLKDKIISYAKEKKIPYYIVPSEKLNNLSENKNHQGVVLSISPIEYLSVDELIKSSVEAPRRGAQKDEVMLIAHEIQDVHNLGAMIRTFVAAGGQGIILTGRSQVGVNSTVAKTSAGAVFKAQFARATNCSQVIKKLKDNDFWIVGTDKGKDSKSLYEFDFPQKVAIIVGNEHEGLPRLVKENCDFLVTIPVSNQVDSLNVSVAFGIVIYEYIRQLKLKN